jgi:hypothetical protein
LRRFLNSEATMRLRPIAVKAKLAHTPEWEAVRNVTSKLSPAVEVTPWWPG